MSKEDTAEMDEKVLDESILNEFPYPVAMRYRLLLGENDVQKKTQLCVQTFQVGLRTLTLGIVGQYLARDLSVVNNVRLNRLLLRHQNKPASMGTWRDTLFTALEGYRGHRERLFVPELYDLYWDTSVEPHRAHRGVQGDFRRLVEIRNVLVHSAPVVEAGWEKLYEDAHHRLRQVLSRFMFFQRYDMIRVVGQSASDFHYEVFTGQQITLTMGPLTAASQAIKEGWFYLAKNRQVLQLYPLFLFQPQEMLELDGEVDACLYDEFDRGQLAYLSKVGRLPISDPEIVDDFVELWFDRLEKARVARRQVRRLNWHLLDEISRRITVQRMGDSRRKYRPALYLQREETVEAFQEFLRSEKTCLILTGKSGVGKSNFILSLLDEFSSNETVCTLSYVAARMRDDVSIEETLATDLSKQVEFIGVKGKGRLEDALAEIARVDGMDGKRLILFIDAINEHPRAKELLRRIDALVAGNAYPWLKVVITCRPETWRTIKQGVPLAEHKYYRQARDRELGVEIASFHYADEQAAQTGVRVEPFTGEELRQAYIKHQDVYGLATPYEQVPAQIKRLLRDPLVLWLVAETYRKAEIPSNLSVGELVRNYLEKLSETERLERGDLAFLEREVMPLFFQDDHYTNVLTSQQVKTTLTTDGRNLEELLFNSDLLPGGRFVNQSYHNLVDAGILIELGSDLEYAIGFTYERFYEFFAGRQLHRAARDAPDPLDSYRQAVDAMPDHLFLWGAVVQALTADLESGNLSLLVDLAGWNRDNRLLRSALVTALTRFGEESLSRAKSCVKEMLGELTPAPRSAVGALWRLLRPTKDARPTVEIRKSIAIETASNLKMTDLLRAVAADASPKLRAEAAQHTFYLWKRDQEAGFRVLDGLSHRVTGRFGIPNLGVAESVLALAAAILGYEHRNPQVLEELLLIGRGALRRVLLLTVKERDSGLLRRVRRNLIGFLHERVVGTILKFVIRVMSGWADHAWVSLDGMAHVFGLSHDQKSLLRTFLPLLDPDTPGLGQRVADIVEVEEWGDQIGQAVVELCILAQGVADFDETLSVVRELTDVALSRTPPRFWAGGPHWNLWQSAMRQERPDPEFLTCIERVTAAVQKDPEGWAAQAKLDRPVSVSADNKVACLSAYIGANYLHSEDFLPTLLVRWLERAMRQNDEEYLQLYVTQELTVLFECGLLHVTLPALGPIVNYDSPTVRDTIVEFLIRARNQEPEYVEDYLLQSDFPAEIVARVLASPTSENLVDLVTYQLAMIIYDLFVLGPKPLRLEFQYLISQMLEPSNIQEWLELVIKEFVNLLTGELVFRVPEDAPSRRWLQMDGDGSRSGL